MKQLSKRVHWEALCKQQNTYCIIFIHIPHIWNQMSDSNCPIHDNWYIINGNSKELRGAIDVALLFLVRVLNMITSYFYSPYCHIEWLFFCKVLKYSPLTCLHAFYEIYSVPVSTKYRYNVAKHGNLKYVLYLNMCLLWGVETKKGVTLNNFSQ